MPVGAGFSRPRPRNAALRRMNAEPAKHKHHHLPRVCYVGEVCVSITACIDDGRPIFDKSDIVATFTDILEDAVKRNDCIVPVYCFMPEHLHALIKGLNPISDVWRVIARFKQRTGYWFSKNSYASWQKDFWDRILRRDESFANQVRYIVNNPVRRGLVENWEDYPYTGSIGMDLKELLSDVQTT